MSTTTMLLFAFGAGVLLTLLVVFTLRGIRKLERDVEEPPDVENWEKKIEP